MRRPRPAAALTVVMLSCAFLLALAGTTLAQDAGEGTSFSYDHDQSSWFWRYQLEPAIGLLGPLNQQLRLPSPQAPDTLPVAVDKGGMEKVSTLQFDLAFRGIPGGREVQSFTVTLAEGTSAGNEGHQGDRRREFNVEGKQIEACAITDEWAAGSAEPWTLQPDGDRPKYDPSSCSPGARDAETDPARPSSTFDLTSLARAWAGGSMPNRGVMLVPVLAGDSRAAFDAWQVNLKLPAREDGRASNGSEFDATKGQFVMDVAFATAEAGSQPSGEQAPVPSPPPPPLTGAAFPAFDTTGSTFNTSNSALERARGRGPVRTTFRVAGDAPPAPSGPRLPWFVWLLLPGGVVLLAMVHAAVVEPAEGPPGEDVVEAVRSANDAARAAGTLDRTVDTATTADRRPPPSLGELARRGALAAGRVGAGALRRRRSR